MSSNKQYLFKPRAEQDLEDIYDYTVSEFGEEQADLYTSAEILINSE